MILNHQPRLLPLLASGGAINVVPVPLRRDDPSSPWCYAASLAPPIPLDGNDGGGDGNDLFTSGTSSPTTLLPPGSNFLATQVWPSSRIASMIIERHADPSWTVCELGCGPGLPSMTAAKIGARSVVATDVDELALEMVRAAAVEQGYIKNPNADIGGDLDERRFFTRVFDLTSQEHRLPKADLYILSDVFESAAVAEGAASHVSRVLSANRQISQESSMENSANDISRVWVFAQSDRAQRESFLGKMRDWYELVDDNQRLLDWSMDYAPDHDEELWLFDLDETLVEYN